jgi:hypothetical protein
MRNAQLEPLEPYPGSRAEWRCRCLKCGRIASPWYSTIQRGSGGCRWCHNSGFKAAHDAVVYLITHPGFGAVKIGITDSSGSRLKKHTTRGWQVLCTVAAPGERAILIEAEILDWWRGELALSAYLGQPEMSQGGWTETVSAEEIDLVLTIHRIRHLAEAPGSGRDFGESPGQPRVARPSAMSPERRVMRRTVLMARELSAGRRGPSPACPTGPSGRRAGTAAAAGGRSRPERHRLPASAG